MPNKRIVDGIFLGASLATLYDVAHPPLRDLLYFLPWVLVLPFLDSIAASLHSVRTGSKPGGASASSTSGAACTNLRALHLACSLSARTSLLIRTSFGLQCMLAGYTLWRTGAPGWVSVLGLTLLTGLYACWFSWRLHAIDETERTPSPGGGVPPRGIARPALPSVE